MANFNDHLNQATKNFSVLAQVNGLIPDSWDWQVTISYYTAVHLANAHIAITINQHYRTHAKVGEALNPYIPLNPSCFDEQVYNSYQLLTGLSRRSRYLCSDDPTADSATQERLNFTSEKHFAKAVRHLNIVIEYFCKTHKISFSEIKINCDRIKKDNLKYIKS